MWGPPKVILSDQGTEFNNQLLNSLMKTVGVERRISSGYHPRTSGLVERFNHCFVEALRKVTDEDNESWPKWIPFVLMAFRSKVHSSTNFTPFELMFGRKMNFFSDWRGETDAGGQLIDDNNPNQVNSLASRASELKQLIQVNRIKAIENIQAQQVIQKKNQNSNHRITQDLLPIGTKVYVRTMGLHDKLYPKYRGPFTIVERTKNGNYFIENLLNERMSDSYPLQRLKIVSNSGELNNKEEFFHIHKILEERTGNDGKPEFLIRWRGFKNDQNTWEPISNIMDKDLISKFRATRSNKKAKKSNLVTPFLGIFLILLSLPLLVNGQKEFRRDMFFCHKPDENLNNLPILLVEESCNNWKQNRSKIDEIDLTKTLTSNDGTLILSKKDFNIRGQAYECKATVKMMQTWTNLFGAESAVTSEHSVLLTREECFIMVETKRCQHNNMTCSFSRNNQICEYLESPKPIYKYLTNVFSETVSCEFRSINIALKGEPNNTNLISDCKANRKFCKLTNSVVVWDSSLYETCQFEIISEGFFYSEKAIDSKFSNAVREEETNHYFKVIKKLEMVEFCKGEIYKTAEGLYLVRNQGDTRKSYKETDAGMELSKYHELMLSEQDGNMASNWRAQLDLKIKNCELELEIIKSFKNQKEHFEVIKTPSSGKDVVIYANNGIIWLPRCTTIESFSLKSTPSEICYNDLRVNVKFKSEKEEFNGYLTEANVITHNSTQRSCDKTIYRLIYEGDVPTLISEKNNIVKIHNNHFEIFYPMRNPANNIHHYSELMDQIDIEQSIWKITHDDLIEQDNIKFIEVEKYYSNNSVPSVTTIFTSIGKTISNVKEIITNKIPDYIENIIQWLKNVLISFIVVITSILLFVIIVWIVIHIIKIKKHRKTESNRDMNKIYNQDEEINKLELNKNKDVKNRSFNTEILDQENELLKQTETEVINDKDEELDKKTEFNISTDLVEQNINETNESANKIMHVESLASLLIQND